MFKIHFEDQHLVVFEKPAGLECQPNESKSVVSIFQDYLGRPYVGLVHRLDRNTEGLMVIAKRTKSASRLSEDFRLQKVQKLYFCHINGTLSYPICFKENLFRDKTQKKTRVGGEKESRIAVFPVQSNALLVEILEGRTHQIRALLAYHKLPLQGDFKYGASYGNFDLKCVGLRFFHPMSKEVLTFFSDDRFSDENAKILNPKLNFYLCPLRQHELTKTEV